MVNQVHVEVYCQQRACKIRLFLKKKPTISDGLSRWRAYSLVIVLTSAHLSSSDNILFIAYMLFIARSAFDEYTTGLTEISHKFKAKSSTYFDPSNRMLFVTAKKCKLRVLIRTTEHDRSKPVL